LSQNQVPAKVVWCKKLENTTSFRYGVGVEFLKSGKNVGSKAFLPITPQMKIPEQPTRSVSITGNTTQAMWTT
jgi:Tfp pilus assembly protein PilZ